jgi:hypothetical protein
MAIVAPKTLRGPGTVDVTRPATGAQAGSLYVFTALMDAADIADATLVLQQVSLSLDDRTVYGPVDLPCGTKDRNGRFAAPNFAYSAPEAPPANFTVSVTLPRQCNLGLDITLGSKTV